MKVKNLEELFLDEIRDLYDAEKQLVRALPKMAKAASDEELQEAITEHLAQTKEQVSRLEQVFELVGQKARGKACKGMKGLIEEGQEVMDEDMEEVLHDMALIGAAQRVEHYEMAGYGTARTFAQSLGLQEAVSLLQTTLEEEGEADKLLTSISERLIKNVETNGSASAVSGRAGNGGSTRTAASRSTVATTSRDMDEEEEEE